MPSDNFSAGSSNWYRYPGVTSVNVKAGGGGGGGGGSNGSEGSGGGGGGFAEANITGLAGPSLTVTVGSGGTGGLGASDGANGGDSYIDGGLDILARGGIGGLAAEGQFGYGGGTTGSGSSNVGTITRVGGNGGTGASGGGGGGGGGAAGDYSDGGDATDGGGGIGGSGGSALFAGGGSGGDEFFDGSGGQDSPLTTPVSAGGGGGGAGGTGGGTDNLGGRGGDGQLLVTYNLPTLVFTQQPSNSTSGSVISPNITLQILDQDNNPDTHADSAGVATTVSVLIYSGTGSLSGTTSKNFVGDTVTFDDLVITGTGTHILQFTVDAFGASVVYAVSDSFTVSAGSTPFIADQPQTKLLPRPRSVRLLTEFGSPVHPMLSPDQSIPWHVQHPTKPPPLRRVSYFQEVAAPVPFCGFQNTGWKIAGSEGAGVWTNPGNITSEDNAFATYTLLSGGSSGVLVSRQFSFTLPPFAIVTGVTFKVIAKCDTASAANISAMSITHGTSGVSFPGAVGRSNATNFGTTSAAFLVGGELDMWGAPILATDFINGFDTTHGLQGLVLVTNNSGGTVVVSIDAVYARVNYCIHEEFLSTYFEVHPHQLRPAKRTSYFLPEQAPDPAAVLLNPFSPTAYANMWQQWPTRPPPRPHVVEYAYHEVPDPTRLIPNPAPNGFGAIANIREPYPQRQFPSKWTRDYAQYLAFVVDPYGVQTPYEPQVFPQPPTTYPKRKTCWYDPYSRSAASELFTIPPPAFEFTQSALPTSLGKKDGPRRPSLYQVEVDPNAYTPLYVTPLSSQWYVQHPLSPKKRALPVADHQHHAMPIDPLAAFASPVNYGHYIPVPVRKRARPTQYPTGTDAFVTDSLAAPSLLAKWYAQHPTRPPTLRRTPEYSSVFQVHTPSLETTPSVNTWYINPPTAPRRLSSAAALAQTSPPVLVIAPPLDGWHTTHNTVSPQLRAKSRLIEFSSYVRHVEPTIYLPPVYDEQQLPRRRRHPGDLTGYTRFTEVSIYVQPIYNEVSRPTSLFQRRRAPDYLAHVIPSGQLIVSPLLPLWHVDPVQPVPRKLRNVFAGCFEVWVATGGVVVTPPTDEVEGYLAMQVVITGSALTQTVIGGRVLLESSILGRVNLCQPTILGRAVLAPSILGRVVMDPILPIGCSCDIEWRDAEFQSDGTDINSSNGVTATALIKDENGVTVPGSSVTASYDSTTSCWRATYPGTISLTEGSVYYPELNLSTTTPRTADGKRRLRRVAQYIESA